VVGVAVGIVRTVDEITDGRLIIATVRPDDVRDEETHPDETDDDARDGKPHRARDQAEHQQHEPYESCRQGERQHEDSPPVRRLTR
jgi:hypothetical protein